MGFMDFMSKMVKGEPIFDEQSKGDGGWRHGNDEPVVEQKRSAPVPLTSQRKDSRGNKILPEVAIVRSEYHLSGNKFELWLHIRNNSPLIMELDKIRLLNRMSEIDHQLRPGEQREFRVYSGDLLRNDHYHLAELYYKDTENGDYFCAKHTIEYRYERDGSYVPDDFKLIHPIQDV